MYICFQQNRYYMSYTTDDLNNLRELIASGIQSIVYGDKEIIFRPLDQLNEIDNIISADLQNQQ